MYSSTISNAECPLLRLPQELKDRIYHLVYGGVVIRVDRNNHGDSIQMRVLDDTYLDRRQSSVPKASLRACRQIYHDAKDAFYSCNEFEVICPQPLGFFIEHLEYVSHRALAVRNIYLRVLVCSRNQERECENGFRALAESLKNVRHISIDISGDERCGFACTRRLGPFYREKRFLLGLLELKKLPLMTFSLSVYGQGEDDVHKDNLTEIDVQKREWVQYMKGAILGSD